jgi:aconitate hydratase
MQVFEEAGATMLPNACGPCCGSWDRADMQKVSSHAESESICW